jgi:L-ribulose-5-phosphate 3-epimerase
MEPFEIGACSWSIDRNDVLRSLELIGSQLGLRVAQIGFFSTASVRSADVDVIRRTAEKAGVTLVGAFVAFDGEDYASIERIAETGGFGFDGEYEARLAVTRDVARLVTALGCPTLAVHIGTIPADPDSRFYAKLLTRAGEAADILAAGSVRLLLETGRESAENLAGFIDSLGRRNVGVNYDPANFVVYGTGEPVAAVSRLKDRIENVHIKDAFRSDRPGREYGRTAVLGSGDARIPQVISTLRSIGYTGPLLIECGARQAGIDAVRCGVDYLRSIV